MAGVNPHFLNPGMIVYVDPSLFDVPHEPGQGLRVEVVKAHGDTGRVEYKGETHLLSIWDMWVRDHDYQSV